MILTILGAITGLLGPLLPHALKILQDVLDKRHELRVLELQMQLMQQGHTERMAEIDAYAGIEEMKAAHRPFQASGVQGWLGRVLDFLNGSVRPVLAYAFFLLYAGVKVSQIKLASAAVEDPWIVLPTVWHDEDMALFIGIMSYYFSQRGIRYALENMRRW